MKAFENTAHRLYLLVSDPKPLCLELGLRLLLVGLRPTKPGNYFTYFGVSSQTGYITQDSANHRIGNNKKSVLRVQRWV